jgi:copper chaperone
MTCGHCASSVREEVGSIPEVSVVDVDLASGEVIIESDGPIDPIAIKDAVIEAEYQLAGRDCVAEAGCPAANGRHSGPCKAVPRSVPIAFRAHRPFGTRASAGTCWRSCDYVVSIEPLWFLTTSARESCR